MSARPGQEREHQRTVITGEPSMKRKRQGVNSKQRGRRVTPTGAMDRKNTNLEFW